MVCSYVNDLFQQFHSHNNYIKWINYWVVYAYALLLYCPLLLHPVHYPPSPSCALSLTHSLAFTPASKAVCPTLPLSTLPKSFLVFCFWNTMNAHFDASQLQKMLIVGAFWPKRFNVPFYKHGFCLFRLFLKISLDYFFFFCCRFCVASELNISSDSFITPEDRLQVHLCIFRIFRTIYKTNNSNNYILYSH